MSHEGQIGSQDRFLTVGRSLSGHETLAMLPTYAHIFDSVWDHSWREGTKLERDLH